MAEYIEREAAIKAVCDACNVIPKNERDDCLYKFNEGCREYYNIVNVPAADVVHVVRCKECKWYKVGNYLAPQRFCFRLKDNNGKRIGYNFADDDFCSHGEKED